MNTALVGIETLLINEPIYPIELAVRWQKPRKLTAYDASKQFLLKGMATLLVDAIDQYMRTLARTASLFNPTISQWLTGGMAISDAKTGRSRRPTVAERLNKLGTFAGITENHWLDAVSLLVHWRNECVHGSYSARLDHKVLRSLETCTAYFRQEHRSADIRAIVAAYGSGQIFSNSQLATLTSVTHRLLSKIDSNLMLEPKPKFLNECVFFTLANMRQGYQVWVNNTWKRSIADREFRLSRLLMYSGVITDNKSLAVNSINGQGLSDLATLSREEFLALI